MKKNLFFAAIAVGASLVSCSKSESVSNQIINDDSPVAIQLSLGNSINAVATKGVGAIGSTIDGSNDGTENKWNGEDLYVYMFEKPETSDDELVLAKDGNTENPLFENLKVTAPTDGASELYANYKNVGGPKYYPMVGTKTFDFFAYYIDDAAAISVDGVPSVSSDDNKTYYVNFSIDGTQDIMTAKAEPTQGQIDTYNTSAYKVTSYDVDQVSSRIYSAYSARRGFQPTFSFEHQLVKLNFYVKPMRLKDANETFDGTNSTPTGTGIYITKLQLNNINHEGKLNIAYNTSAIKPSAIEWSETKGNLEIKNTLIGDPAKYASFTNVDLRWNTLTGKGEDKFVGSILLPTTTVDEPNYFMTLNAEQRPDERYQESYPGDDKIATPISIIMENNRIGLTEEGTFEAGKEYNVYISMWGVDEITLECRLAGWQVGGDTDGINNDDY